MLKCFYTVQIIIPHKTFIFGKPMNKKGSLIKVNITACHTAYLVRKCNICLYNFDPLKPHFYTVKLGFTGVHIIFLIFAQKHRLRTCKNHLIEPVLTSTHNLCFEQKYMYEKYHFFLSENFQFLGVKFSIYLNRRVFVM